ncbi:pyridoxal-phosphate dependent enzyme [Streptomyces acidicola]|uniref:pyridoxal-phosphate dependent enzyme n=1 Tax=Streptomyces acidicola TaxID=2596892 RepID=UPI0037FBDBD0
MIRDSLLDTIGHTPVVRLRRWSVAGSEILIKLEGWNPGRSIKDRSTLSMVDHAEQDGLLPPPAAPSSSPPPATSARRWRWSGWSVATASSW